MMCTIEIARMNRPAIGDDFDQDLQWEQIFIDIVHVLASTNYRGIPILE